MRPIACVCLEQESLVDDSLHTHDACTVVSADTPHQMERLRNADDPRTTPPTMAARASALGRP